MMWISLALLIGSATATSCPDELTQEDIEATLDTAEGAYASMEPDAFRRTLDDLAFQIPCVSTPVPPRTAARVHRLFALLAFTSGENGSAEASLAAAVRSDPSYEIPETLIPLGHAFREIHEQARSLPNPMSEVPEPRHGRLFLDGLESRKRPTDQPVWFQYVDRRSLVVSSYLLPTDPLPPYPQHPLQPVATSGRNRPKYGFVIGASTAVAASAALYVLANRASHSFTEEHPDYTLSDLRAHRTRTNALVGGSAAALGLGLALSASFVVTL